MVDIGLRTTRIRTRDNRMVIVPNSVIGVNQVINYTYPDPRYRIQTHVGIAYGTDIETPARSSSTRSDRWRVCCPTSRWMPYTSRWAIRP